jgi:ABC-type branched-subunit amino acid transport system substrate-binding protein
MDPRLAQRSRFSLVAVLVTAALAAAHHWWRLGPGALLLGVVLLGLPAAAMAWFHRSGRRVALLAYVLVASWIIIGFGWVDGLWNSTAKLFLGNALLLEHSGFFSWQPVGSIGFEVTGVLASIASLYAAVGTARLVQAALPAHSPRVFAAVASLLGLSVLAAIPAGAHMLARRHASADAPVIRIGVIVPSSGPAAKLADSFLKAVTVAHEDVARMQTRHRYELVVERSQVGDALQTKAAIERLVGQGRVQAIVGGISDSGQIVKSYATVAGLPHVCVCSVMAIGDGHYNFTLISTPAADARAWAAEATRRGVRRVALLTLAYPSIDGHVEALKAEAASAGIAIVQEHRFAADARDFRELIARSQAARPDAYFVESFNPALDLLVEQLREARVTGITSFVTPALSDRKDLLEGAWYVDSNVDPAFGRRFEQRFPGTEFATHMMPFAYDAYRLLVQGFERGDAPAQYIRQLASYQSVAGVVRKSSGSGNFEPQPAIWEIRGGRPTLARVPS